MNGIPSFVILLLSVYPKLDIKRIFKPNGKLGKRNEIFFYCIQGIFLIFYYLILIDSEGVYGKNTSMLSLFLVYVVYLFSQFSWVQQLHA